MVMLRGWLIAMLCFVSFAAVQAQTAEFTTERVFVPGDAVNVTVVGDRELTRSVTVSTAGIISLG
ncbi:MAG TPA: hypothetical protein VHR86_04255, partial [Armatimonadota bacterium]|nr:hypothetical protein [Armatimonadota bacterium]